MKRVRLHPTHSRGHMGDVIVEPVGSTVTELEKDLRWLELDRTPAGDALIVPEIDPHELASMLEACGWSSTITTGGAS